MHVIQWDVDSLDWKGLSGDEITSRVLTRVQPGSIVLFHNAAEHTPEALAGIIEALIADGYTILPVSQMLLPGDTILTPMDGSVRQTPTRAHKPDNESGSCAPLSLHFARKNAIMEKKSLPMRQLRSNIYGKLSENRRLDRRRQHAADQT
ncbi:MAG: hypothetical protein ACLUNO_14080 [Oscillospiraceae bacterium]